MKQIKTRNTTIDLMRLFLAFLIVFIHSKYMCTQSLFEESTKLQIIEFLARFSVPFFFMVSGYYAFKKNQEYILTQIKKLATLYIVALVLISFVYWGLNKFTADVFSADVKTIPNFIFNNTLVFGTPTLPLWFISASIYIYIYLFFAQKYKIRIEATIIASVLFYLIHTTISQYSFVSSFSQSTGIKIDTGDFMFFRTLIFFVLGYIIASKKSEILSIKKTTLLFLTALTGGLSYIEFHEILLASPLHVVSIYYMLPIFTSLIFILCIAFPNIRIFEFFHLPQLGKRYALYIYLIHSFYITAFSGGIWAFNGLFRRINEAFSIDMITWLTTPTVKHEIFIWLLICLLSLLTAVIVEKIVKLCSPLFHKIF